MISNEYRMQDVVALSKAATRFLSGIAGPVHQIRPVPKPKPKGPDRAGFRELYGSHFKQKLE